MIELLRNSLHLDGKSHDVSIFTYYDKKVKMTYESGNAYERFNGEVWDGYKWNHLFCLMDLNETQNTSSYVQSNMSRRLRSNDLIKKGIEFSKIILT